MSVNGSGGDNRNTACTAATAVTTAAVGRARAQIAAIR
jgi:hypothetical protein